jgi:hypothetical protein
MCYQPIEEWLNIWIMKRSDSGMIHIKKVTDFADLLVLVSSSFRMLAVMDQGENLLTI